jgi:hypothetical protein
MAFGSEEAKKPALDGFESMDRRSYDVKNQGYDQSATSRWLWSGATKDTNTHSLARVLHALVSSYDKR